MNKKSIFLIEDDDTIRSNFCELLDDAGFSVTGFAGRSGVLEAVQEQNPKLVLVDISLGTERDGGFELCRDLRNLSQSLPVVFLSSRDSDLDKVSGLRLGADDYITKDSSFEYILVRIETLLRRVDLLTAEAAVSSDNTKTQASNSNLQLDKQRSEAIWKDNKLDLTLTQYWILEELYSEPGAIKRPEKLMRAANIMVEPNTIAAHVKAIRDRFRAVDPEFDNIKTERGRGYRWLD